MILRRTITIVSAIGLLVVGGIAVAALGPLTFSFFTPERVDPNKVVTFTNTNAQTVNGSDLTVPADDFPATKGTELHSAIPGQVPESIHDITSFQISFNYFDTDTDMPGLVQAQSFGDVSGQNVYEPWTVTGGAGQFPDRTLFL